MEPANTRRDQLASINLQPINQSIENLDVYNQVNQRYPYELGYKHLLNYLKFNNQFSQLEKLNVFKGVVSLANNLPFNSTLLMLLATPEDKGTI